MSHPTRVRGLKQGAHALVKGVGGVAPHAGAWIETALAGTAAAVLVVAPHAGAWIETLVITSATTGASCRTPRGCVD